MQGSRIFLYFCSIPFLFTLFHLSEVAFATRCYDHFSIDKIAGELLAPLNDYMGRPFDLLAEISEPIPGMNKEIQNIFSEGAGVAFLEAFSVAGSRFEDGSRRDVHQGRTIYYSFPITRPDGSRILLQIKFPREGNSVCSVDNLLSIDQLAALPGPRS